MSELSKTIESIRKDFPLISGSNIAYLDNAAIPLENPPRPAEYRH